MKFGMVTHGEECVPRGQPRSQPNEQDHSTSTFFGTSGPCYLTYRNLVFYGD